MNPKVFRKVTDNEFPKHRDATLDKYKRVCVKNEPYPAIFEFPNGSVNGLLLYVDEHLLAALDKFEGNEYERRMVVCRVGKEQIECWAYIWVNGIQALEDKEWNYEEFVTNKLPNWRNF
jgi:gamma-glutamylcyclotransferase (GGCT)/AIG2-like uncharacterized protein YtfP